MTRRRVVIEITETHAKGLRGVEHKGSLRIESCVVRSLGGANKREDIFDEILAWAGVSPVTLLIPRRGVVFQKIILPTREAGEIRKMLDLRVGGLTPFVREELVYGYELLGEDTEEGYSPLRAVLVPRQRVQDVLKPFLNAGRVPQTLTVNVLGLYPGAVLGGMPDNGKEDCLALLDVDQASALLCFYVGDRLLFSRPFSRGSRALSEGKSESFSQDILRACRAFREKQHKDIERMVIFSDAKGVGRLKTLMGSQDVEIISPFSCSDKRTDAVRQAMQDNPGISLTAAVGCLFREDKRNLNLMPDEIVSCQKERELRRQASGCLVMFLVAAFLGLVFLKAGTMKDQRFLERIESRYTALSVEEKTARRRVGFLRTLGRSFSERMETVVILSALFECASPTLAFRSLDLQGSGELTIEGLAKSGPSLNVFQEALAGSPKFKDVTLRHASQAAENMEFQITCHLARDAGGPL